MTYEITVDGKPYQLELQRVDGAWQCKLNGESVAMDAVLTGRDVLSLLIDGRSYEIKRERSANDLHYWVGSARYTVEIRDPRSLRGRRAGIADDHGTRKLVAPMPGKVVRILAQANTEVEAGQGVIVVEAMKMQNELKSPKKGMVQKILAAEGATVNAGEVLAIVE
jgi:biotin carboxyl carrier protein